jgi:protein-S-isoprenylcysteine O-methyltransferase Ste14
MTSIPRAEQTTTGGIAAVLYGGIAYAISRVTILYAIGFVGGLWVPKSVDSGTPAQLIAALNVDIALLALFALQHSLMARPRFKPWTRFVPTSVERSTYVLMASGALWLVFSLWRPIPTVVWAVTGGPMKIVLDVAFWLGWAIVFLSPFLINHFELFGLRGVCARLMQRPIPASTFRTPLVYRIVRHPRYLGFLIAFWSAATMTAGHLLFAIVTTGYILFAIGLEERDLVDAFGERELDDCAPINAAR